MDLKQVEYIVQIAKENNITRAAEKLFITQSALNQQLLKLEKELGTPLFYRSRTDWRPTVAGEIYIKNCHELLRIKKETYNIIYDIAEAKKGNISIGFTPERGITMFTSVYQRFHKEFPEFKVTPVELSVKRQQELISSGDLDIGFLTILEGATSSLRYIDLCCEDILLAIPLTHPLAKYATVPFSVIDLSKLKSESFVLIYKESSLRPLIDGIFESAGFRPRVLFDTSSNNVIATMVKSGLSCGLVPYFYIKDQLDKMAYFYLPSHPIWRTVVCYRHDYHLCKATQRFIELAADYWIGEIPQR